MHAHTTILYDIRKYDVYITYIYIYYSMAYMCAYYNTILYIYIHIHIVLCRYNAHNNTIARTPRHLISRTVHSWTVAGTRVYRHIHVCVYKQYNGKLASTHTHTHTHDVMIIIYYNIHINITII